MAKNGDIKLAVDKPALLKRIQQLQNHLRTTQAARTTVIRASDDSLRQRLALAHDRINQLRSENQQLRDALAYAHGQLRTTRTAQNPSSKTPVHNAKPQITPQNERQEFR